MQKLNQQSLMTIEKIVNAERYKKGPIKLMLHEIQKELGYIPFEAMEMIAEATGLSVADVYGVVTFYTQFTTEPKGKHLINVCMGTACYVKGAQSLLENIVSLTKAEVNKTSADGLFSVDATRCLGACGLAPVVILDGKVYGSVQASVEVEKLIKQIISSERVS